MPRAALDMPDITAPCTLPGYARPAIDIPEGHLGNLTPEQQAAVHQVWRALLRFTEHDDDGLRATHLLACFDELTKDSEKYTRSRVRDALWTAIQGDHPDGLTLRFLRARKWVVERALRMMVSALKWRIDTDVEGIIREGEHAISDFELYSNKSYMHGYDKEGHLVGYLHAARHDAYARDLDQSKRMTVWLMETARLMARAPYDRASMVVDMRGYSLANSDLQFLRYFVHVLEAYYPESLHHVFIVAAPLVFNGVWRVISPWLDPVVKRKISFHKRPQELLRFIPEDQLLASFGGKKAFEYAFTRGDRQRDDTRLEEVERRDALMAGVWEVREQLEAATRAWDGAGEDADRNQLTTVLFERWRELDPYVRARTIYHRSGVLRENDWACNFDWAGTESAGVASATE